MSNNDMYKDFVNLVSELIEGCIKKSDIPSIMSCIIVSSDGSERYTVSRNGRTHKVKGHGIYSPGDNVEVLLPDGKWNRAFIIY